MSDGTLIQWGTINVKTSSNPGASFAYSGSGTLTFPIKYSETPALVVSVADSAAYWNASLGSVGTSTATIYVAGDRNDTTKTIHWVATGRWK